MMKQCSKCKQKKDYSFFHKNKNNKSGYASHCKECVSNTGKSIYSKKTLQEKRARFQRQKEHRKQNPELYYWVSIRKNYKLEQEDFKNILLEQDYSCAICRAKEPGGLHGKWCVDHDHGCCSGVKSCGNCVRGLLCNKCNWGLGNFSDDIETLKNAINYLERA